MTEIMQSIRPKWCELIAQGKKTIEVRKTRPKCETPFKVYIYCTQGYARPNSQVFSHGMCGTVIGEYVCDEITTYSYDKAKCEYDRAYWFPDHRSKSCLSDEDMLTYGDGKTLYGWHISDLKIYDTPKDIREFYHPCPYNEELCHRCKYADCSSGVMECLTGIDRPPQSWCYVSREIW